MVINPGVIVVIMGAGVTVLALMSLAIHILDDEWARVPIDALLVAVAVAVILVGSQIHG